MKRGQGESVSGEISSNGSMETKLFPPPQAPAMLLRALGYARKDGASQEPSGPKLTGCTLFQHPNRAAEES